MLPMSTLPLPQTEREKIRLEPPLTAEGLLRRRALQRLDGAALFDPPNRSVLGLGHARNYTYRETDHRSMRVASFFLEIVLVAGDKIAVPFPISRCNRSCCLPRGAPGSPSPCCQAVARP